MKRLIEYTVFSGFVTGLAFGYLADQAFARLSDGHHGRSGTSAFLVGDHDRFAALHDGNDRVRGSQINSDNLTHLQSPY